MFPVYVDVDAEGSAWGIFSIAFCETSDMDVLVTLRHRDGQHVPLNEWAGFEGVQHRLIQRWNLPLFERMLPEEEVLQAWVQLFARWARVICDYKNVDVETFEAAFAEFENRITPHFETLKWAMSARAGTDVGIAATCRAIHAQAEELLSGDGSRLVRFSMFFPAIGRGGSPHAECVEFAIEPCGDA
jgi:hypothetical protein